MPFNLLSLYQVLIIASWSALIVSGYDHCLLIHFECIRFWSLSFDLLWLYQVLIIVFCSTLIVSGFDRCRLIYFDCIGFWSLPCRLLLLWYSLEICPLVSYSQTIACLVFICFWVKFLTFTVFVIDSVYVQIIIMQLLHCLTIRSIITSQLFVSFSALPVINYVGGYMYVAKYIFSKSKCFPCPLCRILCRDLITWQWFGNDFDNCVKALKEVSVVSATSQIAYRAVVSISLYMTSEEHINSYYNSDHQFYAIHIRIQIYGTEIGYSMNKVDRACRTEHFNKNSIVSHKNTLQERFRALRVTLHQ